MKYEEVQKEARFIAETAKNKSEVEIYSNVMQLINQHVAEVIGEDDKTQVNGKDVGANYVQEERNELRAEQRERAGLTA